MSTGKKKNITWWFQGMIWGFVMFLLMDVLYKYAEHKVLTAKGLLTGLVIWLFAGMVYGYALQLLLKYNDKHRKKKSP